MKSFETVVVGGGPAGLSAACLLAQAGVETAMITPSMEISDPRTVALMRPSINLFTTLGIWPGSLLVGSAPLRKLKIVDDTGSHLPAPELTFNAAEIGQSEFGWNIPLLILIPALFERATKLGVSFIHSQATRIETGDGHATVSTDAGSVRAPIVFAADGRNSALRNSLGIPFKSWSYDQIALVTSFSHSASHEDTSTEYHRFSGPCTTVPLPGRRSSLVWMERPQRTEQLASLGDATLSSEIQVATHGRLGRISEIGPRKTFPMQGLIAQKFSGERLLLIGEAAHVVPPIGAQGLNMSLRDAACAAEIVTDAIEAGEDPGKAEVLSRYNTGRRSDVAFRQAVIDATNRSLLGEIAILGIPRSLALSAIEYLAPLRQLVMQKGAGLNGDTPRSMQV